MRARALLLAVAALAAQGCFPARYLAQAARGEYEILHAARASREVIRDPDVPGRVRRLVASVRSIKAYGESQGLRPTRNYTRYADLHRPAAVWVVQACAPLSFTPKRWSFPVVGSLPYLGFFDPGAARRYAEDVARDEPLDVDVRAASAYSTLGWLRDPVLSTMISDGDEALGELADVVLHESAHATVYVRDQSAFNESLASFVADRLTGPWLSSVLGPDAPEARAWREARAREDARLARLHRAYVELDAVYRSPAPDAEKRAAKERVLGAVRQELRIRRPINNATLFGFETYGTGFAGFERLLRACGGSWPRFMAALAALRPSDFERAQQGAFDVVVDRAAARACRARDASAP
jgi:predicted aminopeptidase